MATNQEYFFLIFILMTLSCINVIGKPMLLTCDTYATSATCGSGTSSTEGNSDCDTCCNSLLERMFDCPPCRYFVLNNRQQGASCFCTVCFKQLRHRRRHHQQPNEQDLYPRFDV